MSVWRQILDILSCIKTSSKAVKMSLEVSFGPFSSVMMLPAVRYFLRSCACFTEELWGYTLAFISCIKPRSPGFCCLSVLTWFSHCSRSQPGSPKSWGNWKGCTRSSPSSGSSRPRRAPRRGRRTSRPWPSPLSTLHLSPTCLLSHQHLLPLLLRSLKALSQRSCMQDMTAQSQTQRSTCSPP